MHSEYWVVIVDVLGHMKRHSCWNSKALALEVATTHVRYKQPTETVIILTVEVMDATPAD